MAPESKRRNMQAKCEKPEDRPLPIQPNDSQKSSYRLQSLQAADNPPSSASWRSLFVFTSREHLPSLVCAIVATVTVAVVKSTNGIFFGKVFSTLTDFGSGAATGRQTLHKISIWCTALTALGAAGWILEGIFLLTWMIFGELQAQTARRKLFIGMLDKEMEWYDLREDGIASLLIRIPTQIRELQLAVSQPFGIMIYEGVGVVCSLGIAFYYSWKLTLVIVGTFPFASAVLYLISSGLSTAVEEQKRELDRASKYADTAISSINIVKAFNAQDHEVWLYQSTMKKVTTHYLRQALSNALQFGVTKFLLVFVLVVGFWFGIYLVGHGLETGSVLTTLTSCLNAFTAVEIVLPQWLVLVKGMAAGDTLKGMMDEMRAGKRRSDSATVGTTKPASCPGDIEMNEISFAYPSNPGKLVLNQANFFFPAGETTFLVGASGSGKSTIGNLLMKYYETVSGEILVDGNPIQSLDTNWLRQNVTLVQQDNVLFNETILQNIAFGRRDNVTREDILNATRTGCLQEMLKELPNGLDTVVGSNGRELSGGQKQRIAIARARLRDSQILILDEATSALDHKGRIEVMRAIREWRQGKTTIIITHDLSQIQDEDYVYVLEHLRVVQEGYRRKLATKEKGTFASYIRSGEQTPLASGELPEPNSMVSTPGPSAEEYSDRWRILSRIFDIQDVPSDLVRTGNRMSFGISVAQANDMRSQTIWSTPIIQQSPQMYSTGSPASSVDPEKRKPPGFLPPGSPHPPPSPRPPQQGGRPQFLSPRHTPRIPHKSSPLSRSSALTIDTRLGSPRPLSGPEQQAKVVEEPENKWKNQPASLEVIFRTIWPSLHWRERTIFVLGFISAFVTAAATPAFAYNVGNLQTTYYVTENQAAQARKYALIIVGIGVIDGLAASSARYALEHAGQAWITSLRRRALQRILSQPKSWFDMEDHSSERLNEYLDRNAEEMRNLVGRFAGLAFTVLAMLVITIIWSLVLAWKLSLVALATGPAMYLVLQSFSYVSGKWEQKSNEVSQLASSIFTETFCNIRVVRALTLEAYFERKHRRATVDAYKIGMKRALNSGSLFGLFDSMNIFILALVYYYAGTLFTSHKLTVEETLQVVSLLLIGIANSTAILWTIPQISASRATATQMLYLTNLPTEDSYESRGTLRLASPLPIEMSNLSLTYPDGKKALDQVNLRFDSGTCTAIVGQSGGGKSTIVSTLLGLYPPDEPLNLRVAAPLTFNGQASSILNISNLRSFMSFVPQTPLLFPASIYENIIYGLPETSQYRTFDRAEGAAKHAGIHTFIESLEQGYNTPIGPGGMGLSGGQAQRINIARALVRRPQVLILDEATSALDGDNSEVVREVIKSLTREGVAVIMITHDVEMMRVADRVVVVENGRVAETGGFEELMQRGGALGMLLGTERDSVGLGFEMEVVESPTSPIEIRKRDSWVRKVT